MDKATNVIEMTSDEFLYLAGLLGASGIYGLAEPDAGQDEAARWDAVRAGLIARRFIAENEDGETQMDEVVAALVSICAFPDHTYQVSSAPDGAAETCTIHALDGHAVMLETRADTAACTYFGEREALVAAVAEWMGIAEQQGALSDVTLPGGVVSALREASEGAGEGLAELEGAQGQALREALANSRMVALQAWQCRRIPVSEGTFMGLVAPDAILSASVHEQEGGERLVALRALTAEQATALVSDLLAYAN